MIAGALRAPRAAHRAAPTRCWSASDDGRETGIEEQLRGYLHFARRFLIAFAGGDDRALHHDVPDVGERLRILDADFDREVSDEAADVREMHASGAPHRVVGRVLE